MEYYLLGLVSLFGLFIFSVKGKYIISPASLFLIFNLLYCFGLLLAHSYYSGTIKIPLLQERKYIDTVTLTALGGALSFIFLYMYKNNSKSSAVVNVSLYYDIRTNLIVSVLLGLSLLLVLFASSYGWHAITHERVVEVSFATTLYAYGRYALIVISLIYLSIKPYVKSVVFFVFFINVVVMLFDGARTTFLGLALGYLFILHRSGLRLGLKKNTLILIVLFFIPAARALALSSDFLSAMVASFAAESTMGGYTSLQGVEATINGGALFGLSYVLDPIIYLLPRALRDGNMLFFNHIASYLYGEDFAPLGGFYYIAEAYSNFYEFGGVIVAGVFAILLRMAESVKIKNYYLGLIFVATFGATFCKVYFANEVKVFLVFLFFSFVFKKLFLRKKAIVHDHQSV